MRGGLIVLVLAALLVAGSASAMPVISLGESDFEADWVNPAAGEFTPGDYFNPGIPARVVYLEYLSAEPPPGSAIPEPTALLLLAFSLAGLAISRQLLQ